MTVSGKLGERVDLLVDAAPSALIVLERDGMVSRSNAAARLLLGLGSDAAATIAFPDDLVASEQLQQSLRAGDQPSMVVRIERADGTPVDIQIDAAPVVDDAGDYRGAVCALRDVTVELAAAGELHERQRLMEQLSNAVHDINMDLELQSVLDRVCERAASLVGADGAGMAIIEGDDAVCVAEWKTGIASIGARWPAGSGLIAEARESLEPVHVGNIHEFSPTASRIPALDQMRSVLCLPALHNGQCIGALYLLFRQQDYRLSLNELDVLELLAVHAASAYDNAIEHAEVVASRARQQAIVDATADGMALVGADGNVASWNAAAESLTGLPAHEAIGSPPPFPDDDSGRSAVDYQLATGRWLEIIASPVAATGEQVLDFRDITQTKRLEEARDLFLATTSHELRTPITVIQGFAGTLVHRWDALTDAERRDGVATIVHRAESLAALVDQLLLGSRTDAGFVVDTTAFDIGAALRGALAGFEALSEGHTLVLHVPTGLPLVAGDRGNLDNVVAQLIENAIKYSPEGGYVHVTAAHEGDVVAVRVSDEGIGLDDDDAQLIFERFYQAGAGDRRRFGGLGLGLYIVRKLIEAQGGVVRAYGTPGVGATVEFTLPVAGGDVPAGADPIAVAPVQHEAQTGR